MLDLKEKCLFLECSFFSFFQAGLDEFQDQKVAVTREKEKADHENKKLVSSDNINLFEMSGHCYSSFKRESSLRKLDITDFLVECDNRSWKRYGKG